jgi:hypothetical protein
MRSQVTSPLFGVLLFLGVAAIAAADTPPKPETTPAPAVFLPVEGDHTIATLADEIDRALAIFGRKTQRSSLKLDDLMLAVGCKAATVACLQNIGQSISTPALIMGRARRAGDGVEVSLRWFDVRSGADLGQAVRLLPFDAEARQKILAGAVRDLLGIKGGVPGAPEIYGGLSISASAPYVEVVLNGQPRGVVPLELRNLGVGTYTVLARREGYVAWEGKAEVKADQMTRLEIDMVPLAQGGVRRTYLEAVRTRTWVVGGVGLVCLGMGVGFGAHMRAQQNHMDQSRGLTLGEIQQMEDYKQTGERDALAANVLFGVGGAAVLTAAVLSYLDFRRSRVEEQVIKTSRLQVGPGSVRFGMSF